MARDHYRLEREIMAELLIRLGYLPAKNPTRYGCEIVEEGSGKGGAHLSPAEARNLAAELVQRADEVERQQRRGEVAQGVPFAIDC